MTNPMGIAALLTALVCLATFLFLMKPFDPVVIMCRWLYALRRGVWILGTMLWDAPSEAKHRWVTQRPADRQALSELEREFPAGTEAE